MDALGHVNNAEYLRYFEQSRIEWFETLGIRVTGEGEGPVLLKATVTWLRPVVYPCEIEVRLLAGRTGNTSFHVGGEIVNGRDAAERFTEADFVIVWTDYATARPVRLPDHVRAVLEAP
jgi:acyl-CoA thioester hydrolase